MIKCTVKLEGDAASGTSISVRALSVLLAALSNATQRSLRLRVEGRSHLRGEVDWLNAATDVQFRGMSSGSTVLEFETRTLGETAPEIFLQLPFWDSQPLPDQTAFELFAGTLYDAMNGNEESDLLDGNVLDSISGFDALLALGYTRCTFTSSSAESVSMSGDGLRTAERLRSEVPAPVRVIVSGVLDQVTVSRRAFVMRQGGQSLRGTLTSDGLGSACNLLGENVVVEGEASFRPSGAVSVVSAHTVRRASPEDRVWEQTPRPAPRLLADIRPQSPLPPGASGFDRIFGAWESDESDEEVALALAELS